MRSIKLILSACMMILIMSFTDIYEKKNQSVNVIIGDDSYLHTYGELPSAGTNEQMRIQTHLQYVEAVLRAKDVTHLTTAQKKNRMAMLDLLHEYWKAGVFPTNYDYPNQRIPCFIDKDGNICAVGYLIEQTAGREVAENINNKFKYTYLLNMHTDAIDAWIQTSGLTMEECAMIQPTYSYTPYNNLTAEYIWIGSVLTGMNVSLCTVNGIQIGNGNMNKLFPVLGIMSGVAQIALANSQLSGYNDLHDSEKAYSFINIGLGTTTISMGVWNLIANRPAPNKPTTWHISSFETVDHQQGMRLGVQRTF
jgi:hypothetical protein